ncbi:MAG: hypothetical protein D6769_01035 [Methanobacteriota archaeon]|nr:MAG: hypothetical protein D6769_01035 [Euryarchaeota archaeon]
MAYTIATSIEEPFMSRDKVEDLLKVPEKWEKHFSIMKKLYELQPKQHTIDLIILARKAIVDNDDEKLGQLVKVARNAITILEEHERMFIKKGKRKRELNLGTRRLSRILTRA